LVQDVFQYCNTDIWEVVNTSLNEHHGLVVITLASYLGDFCVCFVLVFSKWKWRANTFVCVST